MNSGCRDQDFLSRGQERGELEGSFGGPRCSVKSVWVGRTGTV